MEGYMGAYEMAYGGHMEWHMEGHMEGHMGAYGGANIPFINKVSCYFNLDHTSTI